MPDFECAPLFEQIKQALQALSSEESSSLVEKGKGNFMFSVEKGDKNHSWLLLLESKPALLNGSDEAELCKNNKPSVTLMLEDHDMSELLRSKLEPTKAFMTGKLRLEGNMMLAMKLQSVLSGFSDKLKNATASKLQAQSTQGSSVASKPVENAQQQQTTLAGKIIQNITKQVASSSPEQLQQLREKTNSVIQFDLKGNSGKIESFTLNLANSKKTTSQNTQPVLSGTAKDNGLEAKLTLELKDKDFMSMMNKKLTGQAAYIQGKLKIAGDIFLAMKLDSVFKIISSAPGATKSKL